jgi:hypothetical protein
MKPAVCIICGKSSSQIEGDWVEFSDYVPLSKNEIGHPKGLEWFCCNHLSAVKSFVNYPSEDGINLLKNKFGVLEPLLDPKSKEKHQNKKKSIISCIISAIKSAKK